MDCPGSTGIGVDALWSGDYAQITTAAEVLEGLIHPGATVKRGEKTIAVDTHIFRVSNRTNLAPGKNVEEVEEKLEKVVPDQYKLHAHHWLILHGRYTCIARKPLCPVCVVRDLCRFKDKTKELAAEKPKTITKSSKTKTSAR